MKRSRRFLISGLIAVSLFSFYGCSSDTAAENTSMSQEQEDKNDKFFEITELINAGSYDEALVKMEERYKDTDYASVDGSNKMIQYRLFYEKQGMYDEAMTVVLDYLTANGYTPGYDGDDASIDIAVESVADWIDLVSEEIKARATEVTGISASASSQATEGASAESAASSTETASNAIAVSAGQLINDYEANEFGADQKYKGKVLQVSGIVYKVSTTDDGGALLQVSPSSDSWDDVWCYFYDAEELQKVSTLTTEQSVTVEGLCEGNDFYIELSNCKIVQ